MTRSLLVLFACLIALPALAAERKDASTYPNRPIRIVVGFSPGSTTDILARTVAAKLNEAWGQPVVVDNRPSGGGVAASQAVVSATPDGHTLISVSAGHAVSARRSTGTCRTTRSAILPASRCWLTFRAFWSSRPPRA